MLKLLSPLEIQGNKWRAELAENGIQGGWNYYLDHAFLYEEIASYVAQHNSEYLTILDVGCGNSMLHTFLEDKLHLGIIGVDRVVGHCPFDVRDKRMDLCIDFNDNEIFHENVDIVFWNSAIEHNEIDVIKKSINASHRALKSGGLFLATFAISPETHWFPPAQQTNLSIADAESTFNDVFEGPVDFYELVKEYKSSSMDLFDRHRKRFGTDEFSYIVGASRQIKS